MMLQSAQGQMGRQGQWKARGRVRDPVHTARPGPHSRREVMAAAAAGRVYTVPGSNGAQLQLVRTLQRPAGAPPPSKLLVFLPGTDGTGQAILPQVPGLHAAGYEVFSFCMPPPDRSSWGQLTVQVCALLRKLLADSGAQSSGGMEQGQVQAPQQAVSQHITLVGESFGGALALRVASAAPDLLERCVVLNPATCFNQSLGGLSSLVSATNLLGLFPDQLYAVAQATLLPLLVDSARLDPQGAELMKAMVEMRPVGAGAGAAGATSGGAAAGAAAPGFPFAFPQLPTGFPLPLPPLPGGGGGGLWEPSQAAAAANHRANMLRDASLADSALQRLQVPTLIISSARDRLLPSLQEGSRLHRLIPGAQKVVLPDSGHAAMLETGISLAAIMRNAPVTAPTRPGTRPSGAAAVTPGAGSSAGMTAARSQAGRVQQRRQGGKDEDDGGSGSGGEEGPSSGPSAQGSFAGSATEAQGQTAPAWSSSAAQASREAAFAQIASTGASRSRGPVGQESSGKDGSNGSYVESYDEWMQILAPWRDLVSPVVLGTENLPAIGTPLASRPMLFVGNHQRVGFYDTPLIAYELAVRGYRVRGLAHPGHWAGPVGGFFEKFGAVKASPMAAFKLLKAGEKVLLFPGGAKEVAKPRGTEYTLLWKEAPDFVRMAAKCNALIIPFAAVGADDAYDMIMDPSEVVAHPVLGPIAKRLSAALDPSLDPATTVMPLTRLPGIGLPSPIPIPNLQRLYFKFAAPIDARAALGANPKDTAAAMELYGRVRGTVEQAMQDLLEYREQDSGRSVGGRIAESWGRWGPLWRDTATQARPGTSAAAAAAGGPGAAGGADDGGRA